MNLFKKIYWIIFPVLCVVFILILDKIFKIEHSWIQTLVGISLAYILSPKVKVVGKQNGEEEQIKWLFFKKVIDKEM
ncbi:hypothetical protein MC378_05235 [Polaribacter sp. MSW13]|uniref:Uncharacterized protein n=1 Tax=Polaribacter marinus TaxID=2916838 RepID=A0A9X1VLW4_9FLAO|nr:hypothetical protein [Polaribacter marinus]MCI2228561.1 hypothetical protein [Polaribacter marinus]